MNSMRKIYEYDGPVKYFAKVCDENFKARTWAATPRKALNDLIYRYKKEKNYGPEAKIVFDPKYLKEV